MALVLRNVFVGMGAVQVENGKMGLNQKRAAQLPPSSLL